jgi:large conductance mechanosensitive channel
MLQEFKAFLVKQNALALAVGVILGSAMNDLVKGLVDDIIMPIVTAITPTGEWKTATFNVGGAELLVGDLLSRALAFVIVAMVAWQISKWLLKPQSSAPTRMCPYCRMSLDIKATRCAFCTSQLEAADPA